MSIEFPKNESNTRQHAFEFNLKSIESICLESAESRTALQEFINSIFLHQQLVSQIVEFANQRGYAYDGIQFTTEEGGSEHGTLLADAADITDWLNKDLKNTPENRVNILQTYNETLKKEIEKAHSIISRIEEYGRIYTSMDDLDVEGEGRFERGAKDRRLEAERREEQARKAVKDDPFFQFLENDLFRGRQE